MIAISLAACHSTPYDITASALGPRGRGDDILLTYNPLPDYWPTFTADSTGLLYAFVRSENVHHRCVGMMPSTGGQRTWEWCDDRPVEADSLNSVPAYALAHDGRFLYFETAVGTDFPYAPRHGTLWLADSANPTRRRDLVDFPTVIGDSTIDWLADLSWTGPDTFLGLAQRMVLLGNCMCSALDSVFYGAWVVGGTTTTENVTLSPIAGTDGASAYALADNGASIIFTTADSPKLWRVPVGGGTATAVAVVTSRIGVQLLGLSCRASMCLVAVGPASAGGAFELRSVSLVDGDTTTVLVRSTPVATPLLARSGDVIAQTGVMLGHLQTLSSAAVDLHLYPALAP